MDSVLLNIALVLFLGIVFIILFVIWSHYNIARPIQKLENTIINFAYKHRESENADSIEIVNPGIHTHNEIESLANAVVKMSRDMRTYMENAIEAERKARILGELANKDSLTRVGNKTAYDNYVLILNKRIKEGWKDFAVVMMDLNHLKVINDTYGHEHGDDYIKMSCHIICHIFSNSPVFRTGGDEFVVIIKDEDFEVREKLYKEAVEVFKTTAGNTSLEPWERSSAAIGISDFNPKTDSSVEDVFNRADSMMYENKAAMKELRKE